MTAKQALEILDYLKTLESRVIDLEKQMENQRNEKEQ